MLSVTAISAGRRDAPANINVGGSTASQVILYEVPKGVTSSLPKSVLQNINDCDSLIVAGNLAALRYAEANLPSFRSGEADKQHAFPALAPSSYCTLCRVTKVKHTKHRLSCRLPTGLASGQGHPQSDRQHEGVFQAWKQFGPHATRPQRGNVCAAGASSTTSVVCEFTSPG